MSGIKRVWLGRKYMPHHASTHAQPAGEPNHNADVDVYGVDTYMRIFILSENRCYLFIYPPLLKSTHTTYRTKCKQATYCTKY